jgi:hypothetical protein
MIIGDTSSSSKKVLSKALKHSSSTLEVYKKRNSVRSKPKHFENKSNVLFRVQNLVSQFTSKFMFLQSTNLGLISQIN